MDKLLRPLSLLAVSLKPADTRIPLHPSRTTVCSRAPGALERAGNAANPNPNQVGDPIPTFSPVGSGRSASSYNLPWQHGKEYLIQPDRKNLSNKGPSITDHVSRLASVEKHLSAFFTSLPANYRLLPPDLYNCNTKREICKT